MTTDAIVKTFLLIIQNWVRKNGPNQILLLVALIAQVAIGLKDAAMFSALLSELTFTDNALSG